MRESTETGSAVVVSCLMCFQIGFHAAMRWGAEREVAVSVGAVQAGLVEDRQVHSELRGCTLDGEAIDRGVGQHGVEQAHAGSGRRGGQAASVEDLVADGWRLS